MSEQDMVDAVSTMVNDGKYVEEENRTVVVKVGVFDLGVLLGEVHRLRTQVTALQTRMTEMALERQRWRDPARMTDIATKYAGTMRRLMRMDECVMAMRELTDLPR